MKATDDIDAANAKHVEQKGSSRSPSPAPTVVGPECPPSMDLTGERGYAISSNISARPMFSMTAGERQHVDAGSRISKVVFDTRLRSGDLLATRVPVMDSPDAYNNSTADHSVGRLTPGFL